MEEKKILLDNLDKVHTTPMGIDRIKKNLKLENIDVIEYCKKIILDEKSNVYLKGKNWYCSLENVVITINSSSYTIITAHKKGDLFMKNLFIEYPKCTTCKKTNVTNKILVLLNLF